MKQNNTESIKSKKDFIKFLKFLHEDFCNNPKKWKNTTLESYFEALSAYADDIDGYYKNNNITINSNVASWRVFADILKGASIYE